MAETTEPGAWPARREWQSRRASFSQAIGEVDTGRQYIVSTFFAMIETASAPPLRSPNFDGPQSLVSRWLAFEAKPDHGFQPHAVPQRPLSIHRGS